MFCLNDGSFPEISDEVRRAAVTDFLERYFPFPAPWEREYEEAQNQAHGIRAGQGAVSTGELGSAWSSVAP